METNKENEDQSNCECNSGCCAPQSSKKNRWKKYVFALVFIAAASIIVFKVFNNKKVNGNHAFQNDSTMVTNSDSISSSCCPENKSCCETE